MIKPGSSTGSALADATRSTARIRSQASLLGAQGVGQGARIGFHLVAAHQIGFVEYGKFVVIFSLAVMLSTFLGLGMRHRMQLILTSMTSVSEWVIVGVAVPLVVGLSVSAALSYFSTQGALAAILAIGLSATEIAGESLKGEGRPALSLWLPPTALFGASAIGLAVGWIGSFEALVVSLGLTSILFCLTWIGVQSFRFGVPRNVRSLDWKQVHIPTILSAAFTQLGALLPVFFLAAIADEAAGRFAIALRVIGVIAVSAAALGTPTIRSAAQQYWQGNDAWPVFSFGLRRIAAPTLLIAAAVCIVILNPFEWPVIDSAILRVYCWVLLPGMVVGALCGPVTATLYATGQIRPTLIAAVFTIVIIAIGGLVSLRTDNGLPVVYSVSVGLAIQNLYQLVVIRTNRRQL